MSRFLNSQYSGLEAYTPGEQPQDQVYIKLNTNESPYPPAPEVIAAVTPGELADLRLYSDPEGKRLKKKLAAYYGVEPGNVFLSNGSDDILNFAFMAFSGGERKATFPGITYSFYPVFANLHGVDFDTIPLKEDLTVDGEAFRNTGKFTVIANPNAPTGLALSRREVAEIAKSNPNQVVLIDEAYVDFGAESAVPLVKEYENLLVVMTYSKSRSLAGARLGFALGNQALIEDLEKLKYATNPYNVNRLTLAMGEAALDGAEYYRDNAKKIVRTRERTTAVLRELGFFVPESKANFIFVRRAGLDGEKLYLALKKRGILVRHFSDPRIAQYNRVTIGTAEEMDRFLSCVKEIMREEGLL